MLITAYNILTPRYQYKHAGLRELAQMANETSYSADTGIYDLT